MAFSVEVISLELSLCKHRSWAMLGHARLNQTLVESVGKLVEHMNFPICVPKIKMGHSVIKYIP